jgi:hypothetical protein
MGSGSGVISRVLGKGTSANASTGLSPDFQAGGGERGDAYEPTQDEASIQADRPQYIPGSAYAAAFDPAYQALTPYAQAYLNQFNMPNAAQMLGGNQSLEEKLAAAGQNRVPGQNINIGDVPSSNYANMRPDMLIDPAAAGWKLYSEAPKTNDLGMSALMNFVNRKPIPAGAYTDSKGNVWVRG